MSPPLLAATRRCPNLMAARRGPPAAPSKASPPLIRATAVAHSFGRPPPLRSRAKAAQMRGRRSPPPRIRATAVAQIHGDGRPNERATAVAHFFGSPPSPRSRADGCGGRRQWRPTVRGGRRTNNEFISFESGVDLNGQFWKEKPNTPNLPQLKVEATEDITEDIVANTLRRAITFHSTLQAHDGHWPGDNAGPMFVMPILVIVLTITGALDAVLSTQHKREMCRYLYNHQNRDGGWSFHIEGPSTMFGSVMSYVTLRLLGEGASDGDGAMEKGRHWILDHGDATAVTSWGKIWLSALGAFEWSGNNPTPPEIWLLPYFLPFHPGRMWCHCRMVYLPLSYLYGKRFIGPITPTVLSLRKELYTVPYHKIDWKRARNKCAKEDLYYPHPHVQDILWASLDIAVEPVLTHWPGNKLREKALRTVMDHIHYEDENTHYLCLGPLNKMLNMLCCWVEDPNSEAFKLHIPRIYDYLWLAEDGMKVQGCNGSQLWDTAFAVQAIVSTGLGEEFAPTLRKAHAYIKNTQVLENVPGNLDLWYRHISKGAWPFSTADHGWSVSDCTAEGLKAVLLLSEFPAEDVGEPLDAERVFDAVNVILSLQNNDGGFATYERMRSYSWLELINPAETFADIMIDYSHREAEVESCIEKAAMFIEKMQAKDGSWYGSWGVCFTYGTWFGVKGLVAGGRTLSNCSGIRKACDFLLSKQLPCGGWGESYLSCQNKVGTFESFVCAFSLVLIRQKLYSQSVMFEYEDLLVVSNVYDLKLIDID
ncbi:Cycloartenol synthase 2 [Sesamum angolense]|uniref:Terpene cyclase/mutase family member n=1 Tax=Sesamum angolense TaxID=2727404 RepID=A0AAE1WEJ0_9LAMI|nr:Cycloartenol synthase 2 [Sesamum angolense]